MGKKNIERQFLLRHLPSYGDYGIRCGGEPQVIPNTPAPNLRYAGETIRWVRGDKSNGSMRAICGDLIAQQRISLATSLYRAAMTGLLDALCEVRDGGQFGFLDQCVTTPELNKLMGI
jgi:hypothetical protein